MSVGETRNLGAAARRSRILTLPDGRTYEAKALTLADWATLEEEALQSAKRAMIQTYTRNADLLPPEMKQDIIRDAFTRAEAMRLDNLPGSKVMVDATDEHGAKLTVLGEDGKLVVVQKEMEAGYAHFWMNTMAGKLCLTWLSLRGASPGLTPDDAANIFANNETGLAEAARAVDDLSKPTLGNGSPPREAGATAAS